MPESPLPTQTGAATATATATATALALAALTLVASAEGGGHYPTSSATHDAGPPTTGDATAPAAPCAPGHSTCADGLAEVCRPDGTLVRFECDTVQGMQCNPDGCRGVCSPTSLRASYVGCDYYPTVTLNPVWSEFHFAVAVSATGADPTHVVVTRGDEVIDERTVAGHGLEVIPLPWVPELKGGDFEGASTTAPDWGPSRLVAGGAYRLRADHPVTVYQFSPLEFTLGPISDTCPARSWGSCNSYSNDASLLLPVNALGTAYTTAAWPATPGGGSMIAITATEDDTTVTVAGRGGVRAADGIDATGSGTITLSRGDVMQILSDAPPPPAGLFAPQLFGPDVTGSVVTSDKPVQVIAGHGCANVPNASSGYCDHLEEVMFPRLTLDTDYLVPSVLPPADDARRMQVVRVVAAYPDMETIVRFDPPIVGETTLDAATPYIQLDDVPMDLHVQSSAPVLVAQIMEGATSVDPLERQPRGDPALSLVVPVRQYRADYLFYASRTYTRNLVSIVAPASATVRLDDWTIPDAAFSPIGASGFKVTARELTGEIHRLDADVGVGITVYGYGSWTSYMYPGGLDLLQRPPF